MNTGVPVLIRKAVSDYQRHNYNLILLILHIVWFNLYARGAITYSFKLNPLWERLDIVLISPVWEVFLHYWLDDIRLSEFLGLQVSVLVSSSDGLWLDQSLWGCFLAFWSLGIISLISPGVVCFLA